MINGPHVFTGTSANTHGRCAHDILLPTRMFTVLMKHRKSLTLRIQTHVTNGLVRNTDVFLFCLKYLHLLPISNPFSITYNAS